MTIEPRMIVGILIGLSIHLLLKYIPKAISHLRKRKTKDRALGCNEKEKETSAFFELLSHIKNELGREDKKYYK